MKRYGKPKVTVTDRLRSYKTTMKELGNSYKQETGRGANNRVENSHLPIRRNEKAMYKFRREKSLQKFVSIHSTFHNHFNSERLLLTQVNHRTPDNAGKLIGPKPTESITGIMGQEIQSISNWRASPWSSFLLQLQETLAWRT